MKFDLTITLSYVLMDNFCSCFTFEYISSDPSHGKGVRKNQYKSIPQTDPSNNQKKTNNANDSKEKR